jgi:hypothetical protein
MLTRSLTPLLLAGAMLTAAAVAPATLKELTPARR